MIDTRENQPPPFAPDPAADTPRQPTLHPPGGRPTAAPDAGDKGRPRDWNHGGYIQAPPRGVGDELLQDHHPPSPPKSD